MSVNVLVVDSGVNSKHPCFKNSEVETFDFINGQIVVSNNIVTYGHGTAVASIIARKQNVKIMSVKIDDIENGVDEEQLISLLRCVSKTMKVDVINLSLGVNICEGTELFDICEELKNNNTIIVSAFDNAGAISFPAAFSNVIGVTSGSQCLKTNQFEYVESSIVNLGAKGGIQMLAWLNPEYLMLGGNSFACAHVSARIVEYINEGIIGFDNILEKFKEDSIRIWEMHNVTESKSLPDMKKAIIFPFNKEMHSMIRFSHMLTFEIVGVFDSRSSANIGVGTRTLVGGDVLDIKIKSVSEIDWDQFDTVILGHTDELHNLTGGDDIRYLVSMAQTKGKKIFSLDENNVKRYELKDAYYPVVKSSQLPANRFGKLYRISKPVLGVFGTSSKQGKFTLQLKLRELFVKDGYSVGQIGTEPHSQLFGVEEVFPIGYNSNVEICEHEVVLYLNSIVHKLCKNNDLIIVGSQSGTLPYDVGNLAQFTISQMNFLLGTQPDAVILCVNAFDEYEYVERTINYIENVVNCKVIAIVLFPVTLSDGWRGIYGGRHELSQQEMIISMERLSKAMNRKVYALNNCNDMEHLKNDIVDYFSVEGV